MKRVKKQVFRIGDTVKIINPEFVLRVGYPLCLADSIEKFRTGENEKIITEFLSKFCIHDKMVDLLGLNPENHCVGTVRYKIERALAYNDIKQRGFGGNERKIFTEKNESGMGCIGKIIDKRVVKTGKRVGGYYVEDGDGGNDEPPELRNAKSHVLLKIRVNPSIKPSYFMDFDSTSFFENEIEECNVEKVMEIKTE